MLTRTTLVLAIASVASAGCDGEDDPNEDAGSPVEDASLDGAIADAAQGEDADTDGATDGGVGDGSIALQCDHDNGGIALPNGFCASLYATDLAAPRHMAVTPAGDLYVAIKPGEDRNTRFVALRDSDGDGRADERIEVEGEGGNGIAWRDDKLYFATNSAVLRYDAPSGTLAPSEQATTIVQGLPDTGDHPYTTVVVVDDTLYVNVGSASNSCQQDNRVQGSPGLDPCPELDTRAGVWKFSASETEQSQADGERFATGTRNTNALAWNDSVDALYAAKNGRDQLHEHWPDLYTEEQGQMLPSEEILRLESGEDYGWPYCYHDPMLGEKVLAPEYGGDGTTIGRCADVQEPIAALPAHWAPLGMVFYDAQLFPEMYRGGMFLANHGSRFAPNAQGDLPGYNVVFWELDDSGDPVGQFVEFADGFAGDARPLPEQAEHRPVGLAVGPDGALFISDDQGGTIWRVLYTGT